ncbi:MAG: M23 family metallopeptidase [Clostridiales bacterium]|nr:M23 family metallopeptidase [Clostridiales bacterium]
MFKFKPAYAVTISGEVVGYVSNRADFQKRINDEILAHNGNVAFVTINQFPEYKFELINRNEKTIEDELIGTLKQNAETTYKYYAVTFNNKTEAYVNSLEEAEKIVADLKVQHSGNLDLNIGISEYYTINVDDAKNIEENTNVEIAKQEVENSIDEYIDKENKTINGIYLATTPVQGRITSRFGSVERVRSGAHKGLDIAAKSGTPILAVSDGVITKSAWTGSYGNLVVISHGNGVETYYAHCSKSLVKVGQKVKAGEKIALVGSTGNSTGPHLHLEIRLNGNVINPQKYLYKD